MVSKKITSSCRPWGEFKDLLEQRHFKIKWMQVAPQQRLSYQSHKRRAEHWVIVKGRALVLLDEKSLILEKGQHIFIPQGAKHRLSNPINTTLELIEVQIGDYFGEDDIIRYSDDYVR